MRRLRRTYGRWLLRSFVKNARWRLTHDYLRGVVAP